MNGHIPESDAVEMTGVDGANPLGFLAALGTLVTLHGAGERATRIRWMRGRTWVPVIEGVSAFGSRGSADARGDNGELPRDGAERQRRLQVRISEIVAGGLRGRDVPPEAEKRRAVAVRQLDAAKKALADKRKEIRKRGLRGGERRAAVEAEVGPLEREYEMRREAWLEALAAAVPRPELALGKRIDCLPGEYREHAEALLRQSSSGDLEAVDLLAAFGTDACTTERRDTIEPTPFQFITGSGHQYFLSTVRHLIGEVDAERVRRSLFETWTYPDEKLSMRWDPAEDRRYALMDRDPTASGNKARTMWMANLLGYRALALFPAAPGTGALRVAGWMDSAEGPAFTWPLWEFPAGVDTVRSLLALRELQASRPDRVNLNARGVAAAFRARRIKVGTGANYKLNFSPARAV